MRLLEVEEDTNGSLTAWTCHRVSKSASVALNLSKNSFKKTSLSKSNGDRWNFVNKNVNKLSQGSLSLKKLFCCIKKSSESSRNQLSLIPNHWNFPRTWYLLITDRSPRLSLSPLSTPCQPSFCVCHYLYLYPSLSLLHYHYLYLRHGLFRVPLSSLKQLNPKPLKNPIKNHVENLLTSLRSTPSKKGTKPLRTYKEPKDSLANASRSFNNHGNKNLLITSELKIALANTPLKFQKTPIDDSSLNCVITSINRSGPDAQFRDRRHRFSTTLQRLSRSADIESNPGPQQRDQQRNQEVKVISYNVRGLNDEFKLRHLINYSYKASPGPDSDYVVCLQETFIENPGKIPYLWRGNYHLTPGVGNSSGCVTLMNSLLNVIYSKDFAGKAHVLVCQKTGQQNPSYIICNLYAPNANNAAKIDFFEEIFTEISELELRFECDKVIIAGDYNLIFKENESKNRINSSQEKNVARAVGNLLSNMDLDDIWKTKVNFTWNRPNSESFSTIDHIFYSKSNLKLVKAETDWSVSRSDHAAIIVNLGIISTNSVRKTKITRLDPTLLDAENKPVLTEEISSMLREVPATWNPHQTLEFMKVCIRTVLEKAQADRKRREVTEEELVNIELDMAIKTIERGEIGVDQRLDLINYIEELRGRKSILIENKGRRLAERLGTKWYNEGEKSTKYFLRILNRTSPNNFNDLITENGEVLTNDKEIEEEVVNFYKKLYEEPTIINSNDDSFFDELTAVSNEDDDWIARPISIEELGKTLDTCSDSAPGPDGIPYSILRGLWSIAGPILVNAWNYTIQTGNLPPSHKTSFLRLLPKMGKDLKKLTNWRPITLSNCDHKIITKVYANRISAKVADKIGDRQTAYIRGRLINDNVRTLIGAVKAANIEDNINGLIVSLDAKKAFDSVDHNFIEKTLIKFGLSKFVPIFRSLYADLRSDIFVNGKLVPGYNIKKGVKQGDALSCILFIMCIEPLLRNIEKNNNIRTITSSDLEAALPKVLAYADDVNSIVSNDPVTVQEIFNEYQRLTKMSGLELNAEKTEILPIISRNLNIDKDQLRFRFVYNQKRYILNPVEIMKVNGILLQQNADIVDANVELVYKKIEKQLKSWSSRQLTVLGKILIVKTFGISQIIYLMQSLVLTDAHFKKLNHILYKFIWNRHFLAAKAPERISREIMNKPIKLGGLGMLNISELDASLKLKAFGRLLESNHPFLTVVRNKLDQTDFYAPKLDTNLDELALEGVRVLTSDRARLLDSGDLDTNTLFLKSIKSIKLNRVLSRNGRSSIAWFNIRRQGVTRIDNLNRINLRALEFFLPRNIVMRARAAVNLPNNINTNIDLEGCVLVKGKFVKLSKLSSKSIRLNREKNDPITCFKIGANVTPRDSLNWALVLKKLTSVKHKDNLLRLAHGELYSKERLHRYRLVDSPNCPRCDQIETLTHKYFECPYVKEIWKKTFVITDKSRQSLDPTESTAKKALGLISNPNTSLLTIHAEIISRIRRLKDAEANLLMLPKLFVKNSVEWVLRREINEHLKEQISELLEN